MLTHAEEKQYIYVTKFKAIKDCNIKTKDIYLFSIQLLLVQI